MKPGEGVGKGGIGSKGVTRRSRSKFELGKKGGILSGEKEEISKNAEQEVIAVGGNSSNSNTNLIKEVCQTEELESNCNDFKYSSNMCSSEILMICLLKHHLS